MTCYQTSRDLPEQRSLRSETVRNISVQTEDIMPLRDQRLRHLAHSLGRVVRSRGLEVYGGKSYEDSKRLK